jgi:hypothetical protein
MAMRMKKKLPNQTPEIDVGLAPQPFVQPGNIVTPTPDKRQIVVVPNGGISQTPQKEENMIFRNERGRPSGITVGGKTYLGLSPADVEKMAQSELARRGGPATQQFEQEVQARQKQQQTAENLRNIQPLEEPQVTEADVERVVPQEPGLEKASAAISGLAAAVPAGFGAAAAATKIGGMLGTAVAPGVGTAIGAGVGLLAGIGTFYVKMGLDKRQDVQQAFKVSKIATKNFQQTIDALNAGLISQETALERFKEDTITLYAARENLKRETDRDLNRFLSGGADELANVEDRILDLQQTYIPKFYLALANPNPNRINLADYYSQDKEEIDERE